MRPLFFIVVFSAMLIAMFIHLDRGDATRQQILSGEQKATLKDMMKPPR